MTKLYSSLSLLTVILCISFLSGTGCDQPDNSRNKKINTATEIKRVDQFNNKTAFDILGFAGKLAATENNPQARKAFLRKALESAKEMENKQAEGYAYLLLARSHRAAGEKEEAFNHLNSAIRIFAEIQNPELESDGLISNALWLKQEARYPEALDSITRAIELLETTGLKDYLANAYSIAGQCYYSTGLLDKSLDCYHSALKIYENLGLDALADEVTVDIIGASIFLDERQKSIDYAYQFINDGKPKTDSILARVYTNIALAYFIDQPEEAIKIARKALTFANNEKSVGIKVDALSLLGHSLIALEKNDEAKEYLEQAKSIIEKHDLQEKKQQAYNDLARYYYEQGNLDKALEYVNKALPVAKSSENFIGQFVSYSTLHDIYEKMGEFKEADKYSQIIIEIIHNRCTYNLIKEQKAQSIKYDLKVRNKEIELLKKEKSIRDLKLSRQTLITTFVASAMLLVTGLALAIFIAYRNNAKALKVEAQLSRQDPLTKLLNRRAIYEVLEVEIERFERNHSPFSLLIADIDCFKIFNDKYGHNCGDAMLLKISETLKNMVRKQDKVARWGGEEFLIILPETDSDGAANLAEKLRRSLEDSLIEHNSEKLGITMSFGVSQYIPNVDIDSSIKAADEALYLAKKAGRNRVFCA